MTRLGSLAVAVGCSCLLAAVAPALADADEARPRLFVLVSIDQMRADYLDRYGPMWSKGLKRLIAEAAVFPLASFPYMNTVTCAGHATIGTGVLPSSHGMVLNAWWDRATQRSMSCTTDDSVSPVYYNGVAGAGAGNSARWMRMPTFADELRAQSLVPPRIVSLSLKARSAIGMVGRRGDLVLWFTPEQGWTSSTAYGAAPLPWLREFLASQPVERDYGSSWTKLLPEEAYRWTDDGLGEGTPNGWTRTFPHALTSASGTADAEFRAKWEDTPLADAALTRIAIKAVEAMRLGQDAGRTDMLAISYSVLDHVGHAYGPRSHEVQDVLVRLDQTIGDLIDALDARVGRERYVLALTGDHGVSPIPDQMADLGLDASRLSLSDLRSRVDKALEPHLGPGPHVAATVYTDLYFLPGRYDALVAKPDAMRAALDALLATPGIARVYRSDLIAAGQVPDEPAGRAAAAGFHRDRSGDLLLVPQAYWITSGAVATHGTFYDYDARVPLLLFGGPTRTGRFPVASTPADIAPTFAYLAGITMARSDGRVRVEALTGPPRQPVTTTSSTP